MIDNEVSSAGLHRLSGGQATQHTGQPKVDASNSLIVGEQPEIAARLLLNLKLHC
jgi:hypothetical protein